MTISISIHRAFFIFLSLCALSLSPLHAEKTTEKPQPAQPPIQLPGIQIDARNGMIDVDAEICLDEGPLELVACTKGTKEHESVIMVGADPAHIHAALLLIGARQGNPAMRKPINEDMSQWMHYPPSGDFIEVSLVIENEEGKPVERPISDFIKRSESGHSRPASTPGSEEDASEETFPSTFVFAGSHLITKEDEKPRYLASNSGNLITISTFGDETLCLPGFNSRSEEELSWVIDTTHLPKPSSKVLLRLRPMTTSR